jgi:hypothetical protein
VSRRGELKVPAYATRGAADWAGAVPVRTCVSGESAASAVEVFRNERREEVRRIIRQSLFSWRSGVEF